MPSTYDSDPAEGCYASPTQPDVLPDDAGTADTRTYSHRTPSALTLSIGSFFGPPRSWFSPVSGRASLFGHHS
jgi:hypothetical protein